jgi:molybdenum cofactor cytidylyltransferase
MIVVAAIILAAGRSSRMAPHNKLLEAIGGRPVIARVADAATASSAAPVVVVTGYDAPRIEEALRDLEVTIVHNADFEAGLSTSLRAGLAALPASIDGALVLLGDMPFVEASDLAALIAAFATKTRDSICVPVRDGKRGNPVLWGAAYFAEMMRLGGDTGAKNLLEVHRERVTEVEASSDGIFADLDTQADFMRLKTCHKTVARITP